MAVFESQSGLKSFVQGGQAIVLKPLNLGEGLDEITVERELIVKYFGLGDAVMITEGKYKGESAIILDISEDNVATPLIKVDSSHIEVRVNSRFLRTRDLTDTDKMMVSQSKRATQTGALSYKVGDMIKVKVINVDDSGRIKLSRKALLEAPAEEAVEA